MFEFPYMQLPGGILRPVIAVVIEGPSGRRLLDGLLDTGSDRTIFPQREAEVLGIELAAMPDGVIKTAGGVGIAYRLAEASRRIEHSGGSADGVTAFGLPLTAAYQTARTIPPRRRGVPIVGREGYIVGEFFRALEF